MICDRETAVEKASAISGDREHLSLHNQLNLRQCFEFSTSHSKNDPSGLTSLLAIENSVKDHLIARACGEDVLLFAKNVIRRDRELTRSSLITPRHRNTFRMFLTESCQRLSETATGLSDFATLISRDYLVKEYQSNPAGHDSGSLLSLIPVSSELDAAISSTLLDHFLTLTDSRAIKQYIQFLAWVCENVSVNYLTWVPPLLPKFLSSPDCRDSAIELCLTLLISNPVVAHIVTESVPDSVDLVLCFLADNKPAKISWIGKIVKCMHHFVSSSSIVDFIETEFIHNQDPTIRKETMNSILTQCGIQRTGPELSWIIGRLMDRDPTVRKTIWDYIASLPTLSDSLDATLILLSRTTPHQEVFNNLDDVLRTLVSEHGGESVEILHNLVRKSCEQSRLFLRNFFGSKCHARKIIKSIAFVIAATDQSDKRVLIEKQRAIRMCVSWASRSTLSEKSVKKLFSCFNIDLIELLMKLYAPSTLVWPTKLKLLSELQTLVPFEWLSLFTHSVNLFLDKRNMDMVINHPEYSNLIAEFVHEEYREEMEEPGLIDWSNVVKRIDEQILSGDPNCDFLIRFFGKITKNTEPNELGGESVCVQRLMAHLTRTLSSFKSRKYLLRGLLWYDFETCLESLDGTATIDIQSEIAMYVKRSKPDQVGRVLALLPLHSSARRICDISATINPSEEKIFCVIINLIRACELHEDCPPTALVDLVLGLRQLSPLPPRIAKRLGKIISPKKYTSDIIAFCGGVRIDFIPIMFFCNCPYTGWLKFLGKPGWSDSSRRIVEYVISLFVFIGVHLDGYCVPVIRMFISTMLEATHVTCRDNVAATVAATLDSLVEYEPKSDLVTTTSVSEFCTLTRGCLESAHPMIVRMVVDRSYVLSVALALFKSTGRSLPVDDAEKDALILKRRRVSITE